MTISATFIAWSPMRSRYLQIETREVARRMVPRGRGTILYTGATASVRGNANFAAFAGAKHALRGATLPDMTVGERRDFIEYAPFLEAAKRKEWAEILALQTKH